MDELVIIALETLRFSKEVMPTVILGGLSLSEPGASGIFPSIIKVTLKACQGCFFLSEQTFQTPLIAPVSSLASLSENPSHWAWDLARFSSHDKLSDESDNLTSITLGRRTGRP